MLPDSVPIPSQARIALEEPECIQWYVLFEYVGNTRAEKGEVFFFFFFQCTQVEPGCPAGLPT